MACAGNAQVVDDVRLWVAALSRAAGEPLTRNSEQIMHRIETTFAGRPLILEPGRMARQAHGSCLITYGETVVLCTAVAQDQPTTLPFFPLTVEYRQRFYAAGKFPGGFI